MSSSKKSKAAVEPNLDVLGAPVIPWWNVPQSSVVDSEVLHQMLLSHAVVTGTAVRSGICTGYLSNQEEEELPQVWQDFLTSIVNHLEDSTCYKVVSPLFPTERGVKENWLFWSEGFIIITLSASDKVHIQLATFSDVQFQELASLIGTQVIPDNIRQPVYSLTNANGGDLIEIGGDTGVAFNEDYYMDHVGEDFNYCVQELQSDDPTGRLTIISGKPGTGKTYFIRGLIHVLHEHVFILIPSHMVEDLSGPGLVPTLIKARAKSSSDKSIILIIEDADRALLPRPSLEGAESLEVEASKTSIAAVSSLLNISDGILGQALNTRIVCTTNVSIDEIDPALKRAGRLSREIHIGELSAAKAMAVHDMVSGVAGSGLFDAAMPLAEVIRFAKVEDNDDAESDTDEDEDFDDENEDEDEDEDEE